MPLKIVGVSVTYSCNGTRMLLLTGLADSPSGRTYEYLDPIALFPSV